MKRPWVFILAVCVLGELCGLKSAIAGGAVCIILLLFLIYFLCYKKYNANSSIHSIYKFKFLNYFKLKYNSNFIIILSVVFIFSVLRINIENYIYLNGEYVKHIEDYVKNKSSYAGPFVINGTIDNIDLKGDKLKITMGCIIIHADVYDAKDLKIGNKIRVTGKVKYIQHASNPGEFDSYMYYRALGIRFILTADRMEIIDSGYNRILQYTYLVRRFCVNRLSEVFNKDTSGFCAAAVFGDKSLLDEDRYRLYQKNGIAHLLAVSGLHVGIFGMAVYMFLRKKIKLKFITCAATAGTILVVYSMLTGSPLSVVRAVIMMLTAFIAEILGRTYDLDSAAGIAGFCILMYSPYSLFQAGFLLSFSAVFSIGMVSTPVIKKYNIKNKFLYALVFGILIQLSTLPLITYFFYSFPLYGFIINLIAIPLMSIFLCTSLTALIVYIVCKPLALIIRYIPECIILFYTNLCTWFSKLPCCSVLTGRPSVFQIVIYYILFCCWLYIILYKIPDRIKKNKENISFKNKIPYIIRYESIFIIRLYDKIRIKLKESGIKIRFILFTGLIIILPAILFKIPSFHTEIHFIDVGQGDGIYIKIGKEDILIDSGSTTNKEFGKYTLKPFLQCMAVKSIERVFITHADIDHTSGILYLLEEDNEISIEHIYLPYPALNDPKYDRIRQAAAGRKIEISYISRGDRVGGFLCISPQTDCGISDTNEQSIVLLYNEGSFKALFTGDAGKLSEEKIMSDEKICDMINNITLLKVGHHGSFTASGEEFINLLNPQVGILSYGAGNRYGHPHKEVVYILKKYNVRTYETALCGEIEVRIYKNRADISTFLKYADD